MDTLALLLLLLLASIVSYMIGFVGGIAATARNMVSLLAKLTDDEFNEIIGRVKREKSVQQWKEINQGYKEQGNDESS